MTIKKLTSLISNLRNIIKPKNRTLPKLIKTNDILYGYFYFPTVIILCLQCLLPSWLVSETTQLSINKLAYSIILITLTLSFAEIIDSLSDFVSTAWNMRKTNTFHYVAYESLQRLVRLIIYLPVVFFAFFALVIKDYTNKLNPPVNLITNVNLIMFGFSVFVYVMVAIVGYIFIYWFLIKIGKIKIPTKMI